MRCVRFLLVFGVSMGVFLAGCEAERTPGPSASPSFTPPANPPEPIDMSRITALATAMNRTASSGGRLTVVSWMPPEYEAALMRAAPVPVPDLAQNLPSRVGDSMMVLVMSMPMPGAASGETADTRPMIERVRAVGTDGAIHTPIPPDQLTAEQRQMQDATTGRAFDSDQMPFDMSAIREGTHVFFFPRIADPTREGTFAVFVDDAKFEWQLPIPVLLPSKYCPTDGEEFPGDYRVCPRHGVELADTRP